MNLKQSPVRHDHVRGVSFCEIALAGYLAVTVQHSLSLVGASALAEATSFGEAGMSFTRIEAMTSGFGWKSDWEAVGVAVAGAALTTSGATVEAGDLGVIGSTFSITL